MRNATDGDTGSTLFRSAFPFLAVACERCSRRVLLSAEQLEAHGTDRRQLQRLPLVCRCGSAALAKVLLETAEEAPAFLTGQQPPTVREGIHGDPSTASQRLTGSNRGASRENVVQAWEGIARDPAAEHLPTGVQLPWHFRRGSQYSS